MSDVSAPQHPYDRHILARVFFFFALFLMIYATAVMTVYPFFLQQPFKPQLENEQVMMRNFLGQTIQANMEVRGDRFYDLIFVRSGIEAAVYDFVESKNTDPFTKEALRNFTVLERATDNLFDNFLLLSYRSSLIMLSLGYVGVAALCVFSHGLVIRHRRDYQFGDTPLFHNILARTAVSWSVPLFFIVIMLPFALHPAIVVSLFVFVTASIVAFALALPKRA